MSQEKEELRQLLLRFNRAKEWFLLVMNQYAYIFHIPIFWLGIWNPYHQMAKRMLRRLRRVLALVLIGLNQPMARSADYH